MASILLLIGLSNFANADDRGIYSPEGFQCKTEIGVLFVIKKDVDSSSFGKAVLVANGKTKNLKMVGYLSFFNNRVIATFVDEEGSGYRFSRDRVFNFLDGVECKVED